MQERENTVKYFLNFNNIHFKGYFKGYLASLVRMFEVIMKGSLILKSLIAFISITFQY